MQHFFHQQYRFVFVFLSSYTVFVVLLHAQPNLELNLDSCSLDALLMEIMRSHDCGICFLSYMSSISIWSLYIVYKIHVFLSRSLHLYRYIYIYLRLLSDSSNILTSPHQNWLYYRRQLLHRGHASQRRNGFEVSKCAYRQA